MLQGAKTWIRPLEEDDLDNLYLWYNDQEYNLWASGSWPLNTLLSKEDLLNRFFIETGDRKYYGILDDQQNLIGTIGFGDLNIPARSAVLFMGIGNKEYWGQGYGSDALITFLAFLFKQWNFHRISLDTWDGNIRALKTYQNAGFKIEGRQRQARYVSGEYRDSILLGLLQTEFDEIKLP